MNKTKQVFIETFGGMLSRRRGKRTKSEVAKDLGVSYVYVSLLENGKRFPPAGRLKQVCEYFAEPYRKWEQTIDWEQEEDETVRQIKAYSILNSWYGMVAPWRFRSRDGVEIAMNAPGGGTSVAAEQPDASQQVHFITAKDEVQRVPLLSIARCGEWTQFTDSDYPTGVADEYVLCSTRDPNAFFLRAEGFSMSRAGIDPGDLLLVEPSKSGLIRNGSIVLAITEKGQTVKRYYDTGELIILQPDGEEGEPLTLEKTQKDPPDRIYPVTEIRKVLL